MGRAWGRSGETRAIPCVAVLLVPSHSISVVINAFIYSKYENLMYAGPLLRGGPPNPLSLLSFVCVDCVSCNQCMATAPHSSVPHTQQSMIRLPCNTSIQVVCCTETCTCSHACVLHTHSRNAMSVTTTLYTSTIIPVIVSWTLVVYRYL